jgi:hypothetical protein
LTKSAAMTQSSSTVVLLDTSTVCVYLQRTLNTTGIAVSLDDFSQTSGPSESIAFVLRVRSFSAYLMQNSM